MTGRGVATFLGIALIIVLGASVGEAADSGLTAIRIEAEDAESFDLLSISSATDIDYGSFRWLRVNDLQLQSLGQAGVKYTTLPDANIVRVMGFAFDPIAEGEPDIPAELRGDPDGRGLRLIQLNAPITDGWMTELERAGINLLQYYPHNAYLVWADPQVMESAAMLPFVRWQGLFHPAYKINSDLEGLAGVIQNIDVMFYNDGRVGDTLAAIEALGGRLLQRYPAQPDRAFFDVIVELDAARVADVAWLPEVLWMGYQSPQPILDDEMSSQIVAGNYTGGVPFVGYQTWLTDTGFDGSGVIWSITDTGVDYQHPDLNTRIVGGHDYPGCTPVAGEPGNDCGGGHGTHVSGIIGGDATAGFADPQGFKYGFGIAPGVSFFAQNSVDNGGPWPPAGGWQEHSKWATLGGAIGGNQSWTTGEGTQHGYQASERTHDIMVHDGNFDTAAVAEPYIQVFSAGNSGASGLTAPKEAKNIITVASSENYRVGSIDAISSFSSRGYAVDGRVKPDITAPGNQIASTRNDTGGSCSTAISGTSNMYAYCSGTSMAAPHISGSVALVTEWWRSFNAGVTESPAMAKALLLNGTVDMAAGDRPNINEGWGRVHLTNVVDNGALMVYKDQELVFDNTGETQVISVGVPDPTEPLRVTLVWSDAPGAVGANPALVNNLDLTVETGGNTYLGNVFAGGWSTTGGTADVLNNIENVFVQVPGGDAVITIDATAIVGDGVYYSGDTTDQNFALVCYNCAEQADFTLNVDPSSVSVCVPADGTFSVGIGNILGFTDPVTLSASGNPAGTTAGFSVNPVTPPGASTLTIGNTAAAAAGSYPIQVDGTSSTGTKSRTVTFNLFTATPGATTLVAPVDGALNQPARPTFEWTAAGQQGTYRLEVATDAAFGTVVLDETGIVGTTFEPASDLPTNTQFWWRVTPSNACGDGATSTVFTFITEALPGDCGLGTVAVTEFFDDLETGAPGWALGTGGSGNTWALSTARAYSGTTSYHAVDPSTTSDQRLDSPAVMLPVGGSPLTLQFWNWQLMEDRTGACWDGGEVEISTDGGGSWTPLPDAVMLTDPYDGPVTGLGGLDGWCDDLGAAATVWKRAVVDIGAYAGQAAMFRFRLGSDSSVSREGWYVDDVKVQSCVAGEPPLFADDFESGGTSAWARTVP